MLKHIVKVPSIVCLLLSFVSCQKEDNRLEEICDSLRGKYICESIVWNGTPPEIDINGDGESSNDVKTQLYDFFNSRIAIKNYTIVYPCKNYGPDEGKVTMLVPLQSITYWGYSDSFQVFTDGGGLSMDLRYGILEDGSIVFSEHNEPPELNVAEWQTNVSGVEQILEFDAGIVSLGNGSMTIEMKATYYDFATEDLVYDKVTYTFKRVSYDI